MKIGIMKLSCKKVGCITFSWKKDFSMKELKVSVMKKSRREVSNKKEINMFKIGK